ncbi:MAG: pentapeptide repeat-containing protein [Caulobacteraceae bacterium]
MARNLARALKRQAEMPALSQAVLDRFLNMHERFVAAQAGGRRAMVRYLRAPGLDFSGRNLTDADFTGADFQDSRLVKVRLAWGSLLCADLRGADCTDADLSKVDLRGVSLRGANLTGANLDGADMRQAVLARVDLPGGFKVFGASSKGSDGPVAFSADFSNCSMQGARLGRAKLRGANFKGAILTGADLKGADLEDASFDGAVLMGVTFDKAKINPGALANAVLDPDPKAVSRRELLLERLAEASKWCNSMGKQGAPAALDGEDLRPIGNHFARRKLTALSARKAMAIGVDFTGCHLQGANLDGADLRGANFKEADLRGASFVGANLWHAKFDGADLGVLHLKNGGVRSTDFSHAVCGEGTLDAAAIAPKAAETPEAVA